MNMPVGCTRRSHRLLIPAGFTLIELLVVMAVVALLLTVALPAYFGSLDKSRHVALEENLRVMRVALDQFAADKGRYPEALQELVEARYLRSIPVDPITESNSTWVLVQPKEPSKTGIEDVRSGAPGSTKDGKSYEAF